MAALEGPRPHHRYIAGKGRMGWQKVSGYKRHAIAETVIGEGLRAQPERHPTTEIKAVVHVLNRLLVLGRPGCVRIS
jgi:hypothetical protein